MLVEHLEKFYTESQSTRPVNPLRASASGHCTRAGCFDAAGVARELLLPRRVAVFRHGDLIHEALIRDFKAALGWRVVSGEEFGDNFVEIGGAKISYHIDFAFQNDVEVLNGHGQEITTKSSTIGICEFKTMADFSFDRAMEGGIDHEYLCQAWVYHKGTDFNPVVFVAYRKETSAMVEIVFDRKANEKVVTQRFNADPVEISKNDPLLFTTIVTPFDPSVEEYVRRRISWIKGVNDNGVNPATAPGTESVEDEVLSVQGKDKAIEAAKLFGEAYARSGAWYKFKTNRKVLGFPCSYCGHRKQCYPSAKLEMKGNKPIWVI